MADHRARKQRADRFWSAAAGIQHRRRGLVGEQLARGLQRLEQTRVHGPQQKGGAATQSASSRAIQCDALARRRSASADRAGGDRHTSTRAHAPRLASVGNPPSIRRAGAGACTTTSSHLRQAYLGRRVTSTRNCAGTMSSRSGGRPRRSGARDPSSRGRIAHRYRQGSQPAAGAPVGNRGCGADAPHAAPAVPPRGVHGQRLRPARPPQARAAADLPAGSRPGGRSDAAAVP